MQITNTYTNRVAILNEIHNLNDARDLVYKLKWSRFEDINAVMSDEGFQLLDHVFYYLYDLALVKFMIYDILNAVAADS